MVSSIATPFVLFATNLPHLLSGASLADGLLGELSDDDLRIAAFALHISGRYGIDRESARMLAATVILNDRQYTTLSRILRDLAADLLQIAQRAVFYSIDACGQPRSMVLTRRG
jgi:hypothetical protein